MSEINAATAVMNGGGSTATVREDDALLLSSAFNSDDDISFNNNAAAGASDDDDAAGEDTGKKMPNDEASKTIAAAYGNTTHYHHRSISSSSPPPTAPSSHHGPSSSYQPYEAAAAPPSNTHRHYHPPNGGYSSSSHHHPPSYGYHHYPHYPPPHHPYTGHHHHTTSSYHHPHYHHHHGSGGGYYPPPHHYHTHYPPPPPHHHHHGYPPIHHGAPPPAHHHGGGNYPPSATRHSHPPPPPSSTAAAAAPAAATTSGHKSGSQVDTAANGSSKINDGSNSTHGGRKDVAMSPHGDTSNTTNEVNADSRHGGGENNGTKEVNMITPGDLYISKGMRQGLLPLTHRKDDASSASDNIGVSHAAAKAANTAAKLVSGGSYYNNTKCSSSSSSSNTSTAPMTNEQLVQQVKRDMKKLQQENSARIADIASIDAPPPFGSAALTSSSNTNNNNKAIKKSQKRYKDKDGFIYYRRVGKTRNYKKLFERGLVPKGTDGNVEIDEVKVMERVNAIQTIIREPGVVVSTSRGVFGGVGGVKMTQDDGVVNDKDVVSPQKETAADGHDDDDDVREDKEEATEILSRREIAAPAEEEEDDEESSPQLPPPPPPTSRRSTQFLYSHQQNSLSGLDGYELQVVHHADGNDFTVEVVQPAAAAGGEKPAVEKGSSSSSTSSVESRKVDEEKKEESSASSVSSKKNGDFVNAVDSILDAAETIAKRSSPKTSVVAATPQAQHQRDDTFYLPGISYSTKRKCADMIKGYQEKRRRSNSIAFSPPFDYPSSSPYALPAQVRSSPQEMARVAFPAPSPPTHHSVGPSPPGPSPQNAYSQITCQDRIEKRGERTYCYPHPSVDLAEYYSSRQVSKTDKEELAALAICAATHIQKEPVLFRAVLLRMAIERERDSPNRPGGVPSHLKSLALKKISPRPDSPYDPWSDRDRSGRKLIRDGFFWKDYPCLEKVLQKYMMEYYFMSENRPQSKKQQQFNNRLVCLVFQEAISRGYLFDPITFSLDEDNAQDWHLEGRLTQDSAGNWVIPPGFNHKKLRDRIRCYYKTHVQNSKKRLGTLLKNPMKERNRDTLLRLVNELKSQEHVELSSECVVALKRLKAEQDSIRGTVSTPSPNSTARNAATLVWSQGSCSGGETQSQHNSHGFTTTTTPHSSRRAQISDGGSGSSSSASSSVHSSVQTPHHQKYVSGNAFSPFKHASLLSSMRQLDSQRH